MPNEIDRIMSLDPLDLSAQDIDQLITYHREQRKASESGVKPKRRTSTPAISLSDLGLKTEAKPFTRRRL